ncbi:hypothetical protein CONPUDRAFT_144146 [Coniophora puteana RWD-64-598 SS2]|uniref:Peroxisomal membrane protein PEX17 n=1 Tax=Coniophora puteana (strain RWD-64-598) TaxID=741705 RepID=A0A5M3MQI7_CONPW|nr:uncharacterized protein CONPUDRAFT_144146 [Coniophora puteana RWD-64-598 SS2]EIW81326.1 hypothetical protein CONPUDRAFT_144146 [Coniophora puteana RWD-64-598 SS2]
MESQERGYVVLLTYLNRPSSNTPPLPTIQGLAAHYLAHLQPSPTPLAAALVSSALFRPFSHAKLTALTTALRHAVHLKFKALDAEPSTLFTPGVGTRLRRWATAIIRGFEGGHAIVRLACCSGLLLGLEDVHKRLPPKQRDVKARAEDELVMIVADVIDVFYSADPWGREFQPDTEAGEVDARSLCTLVMAQGLLLVPAEKFAALPLPSLLHFSAMTIDNAFQSGTFLSSLPSSALRTPEGRLFISSSAPVSESLRKLAASPVISSMGSLSKLCATTLAHLIDRRENLALPQVLQTFEALRELCARVESDWRASALSEISSEDDIAPETRELTSAIWSLLKILLFTTIMVTEAGLSAVVYLSPDTANAPRGSPRESPDSTPWPRSTSGVTSPTLALSTLHTLSHLSFVISQFGGAGQGAFSELKREFYLALDILSADKQESERFVEELCRPFLSQSPGEVSTSIKLANSNTVLNQAQKAYVLSSVEQLLPVLSTRTIRETVFPLCYPHLSDPGHRETYESAHSVVLGIFASHADKVEQLEADGTHDGVAESGNQGAAGFTDRIVPFYTECLIENSEEGKLSTPQLRLAFSALVRGAAKSVDTALAWFPLAAVLRAASAPGVDTERVHRLHLALVSSIPSLPLRVLPRALDAIAGVIDGLPREAYQRKELIDAVFDEIMERVGDREKEFALGWWGEQREKWVRGESDTSGLYEKATEAGKRWWGSWRDGRQEAAAGSISSRL